mmetsp:Transcript_34960/g.109888  ORF Transcript_34960/g.109888 Transcript_34960/m.109888 type:complete len:242 (-) Transcript_34960:310-1035(-)
MTKSLSPAAESVNPLSAKPTPLCHRWLPSTAFRAYIRTPVCRPSLYMTASLYTTAPSGDSATRSSTLATTLDAASVALTSVEFQVASPPPAVAMAQTTPSWVPAKSVLPVAERAMSACTAPPTLKTKIGPPPAVLMEYTSWFIEPTYNAELLGERTGAPTRSLVREVSAAATKVHLARDMDASTELWVGDVDSVSVFSRMMALSKASQKFPVPVPERSGDASSSSSRRRRPDGVMPGSLQS